MKFPLPSIGSVTRGPDYEYINCRCCGDEIQASDAKNGLCIECQYELGRQYPEPEVAE